MLSGAFLHSRAEQVQRLQHVWQCAMCHRCLRSSATRFGRGANQHLVYHHWAGEKILREELNKWWVGGRNEVQTLKHADQQLASMLQSR